MKFDINEVAKAIGIPVKQWAGNCYGIACAMVEAGLVEGGTAVYGHWTGPIHPNSYFGERAGHAFCQHGWVLTDEGVVVDPTRWGFEAREPYIYVGYEDEDFAWPCRHCGHVGDEHGDGFFNACVEGCDCEDYERKPWPYDEGGNTLRRATMRPAPDPDDGERELVLDVSPEAMQHVLGLLQVPSGPFTHKQLHWLAVLPYEMLQPYVAEIYAAYKPLGHAKAYIPFDNRLRAEREAKRSK